MTKHSFFAIASLMICNRPPGHAAPSVSFRSSTPAPAVTRVRLELSGSKGIAAGCREIGSAEMDGNEFRP